MPQVHGNVQDAAEVGTLGKVWVPVWVEEDALGTVPVLVAASAWGTTQDSVEEIPGEVPAPVEVSAAVQGKVLGEAEEQVRGKAAAPARVRGTVVDEVEEWVRIRDAVEARGEVLLPARVPELDEAKVRGMDSAWDVEDTRCHPAVGHG